MKKVSRQSANHAIGGALAAALVVILIEIAVPQVSFAGLLDGEGGGSRMNSGPGSSTGTNNPAQTNSRIGGNTSGPSASSPAGGARAASGTSNAGSTGVSSSRGATGGPSSSNYSGSSSSGSGGSSIGTARNDTPSSGRNSVSGTSGGSGGGSSFSQTASRNNTSNFGSTVGGSSNSGSTVVGTGGGFITSIGTNNNSSNNSSSGGISSYDPLSSISTNPGKRTERLTTVGPQAQKELDRIMASDLRDVTVVDLVAGHTHLNSQVPKPRPAPTPSAPTLNYNSIAQSLYNNPPRNAPITASYYDLSFTADKVSLTNNYLTVPRGPNFGTPSPSLPVPSNPEAYVKNSKVSLADAYVVGAGIQSAAYGGPDQIDSSQRRSFSNSASSIASDFETMDWGLGVAANMAAWEDEEVRNGTPAERLEALLPSNESLGQSLQQSIAQYRVDVYSLVEAYDKAQAARAVEFVNTKPLPGNAPVVSDAQKVVVDISNYQSAGQFTMSPSDRVDYAFGLFSAGMDAVEQAAAEMRRTTQVTTAVPADPVKNELAQKANARIDAAFAVADRALPKEVVKVFTSALPAGVNISQVPLVSEELKAVTRVQMYNAAGFAPGGIISGTTNVPGRYAVVDVGLGLAQVYGLLEGKPTQYDTSHAVEAATEAAQSITTATAKAAGATVNPTTKKYTGGSFSDTNNSNNSRGNDDDEDDEERPRPSSFYCSLTSSPAFIEAGQSATLRWQTVGATSGSFDNGAGSASPIAAGSKTVTPTETTFYTLTINGSGGRKSECSVFVMVDAYEPTAMAYHYPGTYTFTVPQFTDKLIVEVWGGGGGGSGDHQSRSGGAGGASSFNKTLIANGGKGGQGDESGAQGGAGGTASGGTTNASGEKGTSGANSIYGGAGGAAALGGSGGGSQTARFHGNWGKFPGGGGGGANSLSLHLERDQQEADAIIAARLKLMTSSSSSLTRSMVSQIVRQAGISGSVYDRTLSALDRALGRNVNDRTVVTQSALNAAIAALNASAPPTLDPNHGAGGGGGGYATRAYSPTELVPGTRVTVVVGRGGLGGGGDEDDDDDDDDDDERMYWGGNGASGKVKISWTGVVTSGASTSVATTTQPTTSPTTSIPTTTNSSILNTPAATTTAQTPSITTFEQYLADVEAYLRALRNQDLTRARIDAIMVKVGTTWITARTVERVKDYLDDERGDELSNSAINRILGYLREGRASQSNSSQSAQTSQATPTGTMSYTTQGIHAFKLPRLFTTITITAKGVSIVGTAEDREDAQRSRFERVLMSTSGNTRTSTYRARDFDDDDEAYLSIVIGGAGTLLGNVQINWVGGSSNNNDDDDDD